MIVKKSIMGHKHLKTVDYYRNKKLTSVLDEEFTINYKSFGIDYKLRCNNENYKEAIHYIKKNPNPFYTRKMLYAFEKLENGLIFDLTKKALMFAGPDCDFYRKTDFPVKSCFISKNLLYIITDDLRILNFIGEELVDISTGGNKL
jgi:hypothetical protein